jgi:hypothetical protein
VAAVLDPAAVSRFALVRTGNGDVLSGSEPTLPPGWLCEVWNRDSEGEFRAEPVDGRPALRVSATKGRNAAQFVFRGYNTAGNPVTPDRPYQVRIEYQLDPGIEGYVHFQTRDDWGWLGRGSLPNRGPGWHTVTAAVQPTGKDFQIAIGCSRADPGKFLSLARVEVIAGLDPPPPPAAVSPPAPAGPPVFALDLSRVTPFRFAVRDRQPDDPGWHARVPAGVLLHCWKAESAAEFRGVVDGGRGAIGVTNLNDELSSQILFQFDDGLGVQLQAGRRYRVRVEYRTTNEAEGKFYVRNPRNGEYRSVAEAELPGTGGRWRTVEVTFRRPADGKMDAVLDNTTVGEGNTLFVRSLEVYEVDPVR